MSRITCPEPVRHRIFRDWLRGNPGERGRYAAAKRQAASEANADGEHVMQYNARKQQVMDSHRGDVPRQQRGMAVRRVLLAGVILRYRRHVRGSVLRQCGRPSVDPPGCAET